MVFLLIAVFSDMKQSQYGIPLLNTEPCAFEPEAKVQFMRQ
jgi:hypothetical protein